MKKRKYQRYKCEDLSPIYKSIINNKSNGKVIDGKEVIGDNYYVNKKNLICKIC